MSTAFFTVSVVRKGRKAGPLTREALAAVDNILVTTDFYSRICDEIPADKPEVRVIADDLIKEISRAVSRASAEAASGVKQ